MWEFWSLEKNIGLRKVCEAKRIVYCKLDRESVRKLKTSATSKDRSTSEHLRQIVYEKLGELDSKERKLDTLTTEIAALRREFINAISSLRRELSSGALGWSFPPRTLPRTTARDSTKPKQLESDAPPADLIDDGWQRRERRRRKWGRW